MKSTLNLIAGILLFTSHFAFATPPTKISDPYKYVWEYDEGNLSGLVRFFVDINDDKIPDLFVGAKSLMGTGGGAFHVFTVNKKREYSYLGKVDIHPNAIQLLRSVHSGIHDIRGYWHMSAFDGNLNLFAFNGKTFDKTSTKRIEAVDFSKELSPRKVSTEESGPTLNWKP